MQQFQVLMDAKKKKKKKKIHEIQQLQHQHATSIGGVYELQATSIQHLQDLRKTNKR